MIVMSMIRTCEEYRRDCVACSPVCPAPAHTLRRAMMHALAMIGLGVGGVAAVDDEQMLAIG